MRFARRRNYSVDVENFRRWNSPPPNVYDRARISSDTNWTQVGDSVVCFAGAKHEGFSTYREAATAMVKAGIPDFLVYDGENTYRNVEYEKIKNKTTRGVENNKAGNYKRHDDCQNNQNYNLPVMNSSCKDFNGNTKIVYIDGSCISNYNNAMQAGIGIFWGPGHPWNCSESLINEEPTNNKAELKAAIRALEIAKVNKLEKLIVRSDSMYVVKGITDWVHKWQSNEWKTSRKEDVKNKELWCELLDLTKSTGLCITWEHVIAHSGIEGNEEADRMAMNAAQSILQSEGQSEDAIINQNRCNWKTRKIHSNDRKDDTLPMKNHRSDVKLTADTSEIATPKMSPKVDNCDKPVPGSVNGFSYNNSASSNTDNIKMKSKGTPKNVNKVIDEETTIKCINNVELVLQCVMSELHQIKQHQIEFKHEVKTELDLLKEQQRSSEHLVKNLLEIQKQPENSLTTLSKDMVAQMKNCNKTIKELNEAQKLCGTTNQSKDSKNVEELIKKVDCGFGDMNSSIQSIEKSVVTLLEASKQTTDHNKISEENSLQVRESMTQLKKKMTQTSQSIAEIEHSLTILSESDGFTKPKKTLNIKPIDEENASLSVQNKFSKLETVNDDANDNHKSNEKNNDSAESGEVDRTENGRTQNSVDVRRQQDNSQTNLKVVYKSQHNDGEKGASRRLRKPKVCLIGDSISGQINPAKLGKATETYIKKLRAPKIGDLEKTLKEVKDAEMVIIHTGINNLREREDTLDCTNSLIANISSIKTEAPDTKIVISKVIPIGNNEIDIERSIYNAECEKKIREVLNDDVVFIDHGNLAERSVPIKSCYKPDLVHLSKRGVIILAGNIKEVINHHYTNENDETSDNQYIKANHIKEAVNRKLTNELGRNVRSPRHCNVRSSNEYNFRPKYDKGGSRDNYFRNDRHDKLDDEDRRRDKSRGKNWYDGGKRLDRKYYPNSRFDSSSRSTPNKIYEEERMVDKRHYDWRRYDDDYYNNKRNTRRW